VIAVAGIATAALGTWLGGWVAVPLTGAIVGAWLEARARARADAPARQQGGADAQDLGRKFRAVRSPVGTAFLSGAGGWAVLLLAGAARGPVGEVARLAGGVFGGLPGFVFWALVLIFAGTLSGAAGGAASALVELLVGHTRRS